MEREVMEYDLLIVGAGPAGLAAAIRAKQVAGAAGQELLHHALLDRLLLGDEAFEGGDQIISVS